MTDQEIYADLVRGTTCACTAAKKPRMSFCRGCYGRLPGGVQQALYDRDGGYPDAYRRARTVLGMPIQPATRPDRSPTPVSLEPSTQTHK